MLIQADYSSKEYYRRYLFFKYLPECFYPLVFKYFYKKKYNAKLNLKNPSRLSEKILSSILHDKNQMKTTLSDKLLAKKYVLSKIPELKVANVFQVCSSFNDINFESAPNKFLIKTNHSWKTGILIEDKSKITEDDLRTYKKYYDKALSINYAYWGTPELQYKKISPKIFLEEYLCSKEQESLIREYEVYCFHSRVEFINYTISDSNATDTQITKKEKKALLRQQCFDSCWNKSDFKIRFSDNLTAPDTSNKQLIIKYAEILSEGFPFVRVDFFEVDNQLYFAEFTFTPYSGFIQFLPDEYDLILGNKW